MGLAGNPSEELRRELETIGEQVSILEAATTDYRRRMPRKRTRIQEVIRQFTSAAPVNIVGLARALGLGVRQARLGTQIAGEIFPDLYHGGFSGFTIRVNSSDSTRQKRLTIAHEIAHFLRHRVRIENRLIDNRMYKSRLGTTKEKEAEELGFDLLMPRAMIRSLRSAGLTDPAELANRFDVPVHVMKRRLGIED